MECRIEVGAVRRQVGMGNLGEAGAEYVIEGARVEQRGPSANFCELVAVCAPVFVGLIGADATDAGRSSFCLG
jgi:hypothetical protein